MAKLFTKQLFKFERSTVENDEMVVGKLSGKKLNKATIQWAAIFQFILLVSHVLAPYSLIQYILLSVVSLILARQIALDFAYHIFLDVYNLPLIALSFIMPSLILNTHTIAESVVSGFGIFGLFYAFTLIISTILKKDAGIGGGDIKFAFAFGGFLGGFFSFIGIFLSCVITFILTFVYKDKNEIPFGPGLIIAFWICLLFQNNIIQLLKYLI